MNHVFSGNLGVFLSSKGQLNLGVEAIEMKRASHFTHLVCNGLGFLQQIVVCVQNHEKKII